MKEVQEPTDRQSTSNEHKQRATSNEQQATSNKQRASNPALYAPVL
jgi:hypothetical protein